MKKVNLSNNIKEILNFLGINVILSNNIDYIDIGKDSNTISFLNNDRIGRIQKDGLNPWKDLRSESRVGKFFLKHFFLNEIELENIINRYKTFYNFIVHGIDNIFEIVEGEDIAYWYNSIRYKKGGGTLNSSCMRNQPESRFDLYTKNPDNIKLLIIKEKDLLIGRCLMWISDEGEIYLDRAYTRYDEDSFLFKLYAEEKGYDSYFKLVKNKEFKIKVKKETLKNPPYLDSMIIKNDSIILNIKENNVIIG